MLLSTLKGRAGHPRLPFYLPMNHKGFTLIELVMIIVLLGIIAVFVAPRMPDVTGTKAAAFRDKLRADIRYAQSLAMTRNARFRVHFNAAPAPNPGYAVTDSANVVVQDPAGGGPLSVTLMAGNYAGISVSPNTTIEFDSLGRPYDNTGTLLTVAAILTVNPGVLTVTVSPQTGTVN